MNRDRKTMERKEKPVLGRFTPPGETTGRKDVLKDQLQDPLRAGESDSQQVPVQQEEEEEEGQDVLVGGEE